MNLKVKIICLFLILILTVAIVFFSSMSNKEIVGKWVSETDTAVSFTFNKDGTGLYETEAFKWKYDADLEHYLIHTQKGEVFSVSVVETAEKDYFEFNGVKLYRTAE